MPQLFNLGRESIHHSTQQQTNLLSGKEAQEEELLQALEEDLHNHLVVDCQDPLVEVEDDHLAHPVVVATQLVAPEPVVEEEVKENLGETQPQSLMVIAPAPHSQLST